MNRDLAAVLRANPDVAALALLITLLVPQLGVKPGGFHLTFASRPKAERVWQRLENKMRLFEQRFSRIAPPRVRCVTAPEIESE
jgi:hypothetical protein